MSPYFRRATANVGLYTVAEPGREQIIWLWKLSVPMFKVSVAPIDGLITLTEAGELRTSSR